MPQSPNILFILTDQHRFDCLSAMGHPTLKTPNIDRIAEAGMTFDAAYCPSPVCGPARASLFTGMYPGGHGQTINWARRRPGIRLLTDRLRQRDYHTALVGKLHLTSARDRNGFDWRKLCDSPHGIYDWAEVEHNDYLRWLEAECYPDDPAEAERRAGESERCPEDDPRFWLGWSWVDEAHHMTTWTGNEAVNKIQSWQGGQPLFLNVSFFGPHHPYACCEPWDSLYDPAQMTLPDTFDMPKTSPVFAATRQAKRDGMADWPRDVWREMIAKYYGHIAHIDQQVGRILDALREANLWHNTLIVFAADHGDHVGEFGLLGKGDMYETSARVPLLLKPPGDDRPAQRCGNVVNTLDLFGTFLDAAGAPDRNDHEYIEARSLAPLLDGETSDWPDDTYSVIGTHANGLLTMHRAGQHKIIGVETNNGRLYELYDMKDAAPDLRDVYDDPAYADVRTAMRDRLDTWWNRQQSIWIEGRRYNQ